MYSAKVTKNETERIYRGIINRKEIGSSNIVRYKKTYI